MTTDTTPAALERIVENLNDHASAAEAIRHAPAGTTISEWRRFAKDQREAAAVIAALGAQVRDLTLQRDTARAVASLLTVGEKDNG